MTTVSAASLELQSHLDALQDSIGDGNAKRGFHDEGDALRHFAKVQADMKLGEYIEGRPISEATLRNYYMTKLALIHSEATEAVEELRNGRLADERYYSGGDELDRYGRAEMEPSEESVDIHGHPRKPEGVPSEIADIVIRCFDFADEAGFSLGAIILEKLAFNATRGKMHGGKQV